jgi:hypothetical protein
MAVIQSILDYLRQLIISFGNFTTRLLNNNEGYQTTKFTGSEGVYLLPHHEKEILRLQTQHNFMNTSTEGILLATPNVVNGNSPLRILDAGCADGQ